jgi:hypothetical protein
VEVWLDTSHPHLPAEKREIFYEAVGRYFQENPTAERGAHFLSALREDHEAFPQILREIMDDESESSSS